MMNLLMRSPLLSFPRGRLQSTSRQNRICALLRIMFRKCRWEISMMPVNEWFRFGNWAELSRLAHDPLGKRSSFLVTPQMLQAGELCADRGAARARRGRTGLRRCPSAGQGAFARAGWGRGGELSKAPYHIANSPRLHTIALQGSLP